MLVHRLSFQLTANSGHLFLVKPCVLYDSVVNNTSHTPNFMFSPISGITGLLMNIYSRKNEFEADAYAKETFDGSALISALKRLSVDSLSNLYPHPWYVFFHYSHPPLLKRLDALS